MNRFDASSFAAGQEAGSRVAAAGARRAAAGLLADRRWWGRGRRREAARALSALAGQLEAAAVPRLRFAPPGAA